MQHSFWPHLPYFIPHSPGIAHWWDVFWWAFQLTVMSTLLLGLRKMALRVDRRQAESEPVRRTPPAPPAPPAPPIVRG